MEYKEGEYRDGKLGGVRPILGDRKWALTDLVKRVREAGGFTLDTRTGETPGKGFVVSLEGFERRVPLAGLTDLELADVIEAYYQEHKEVLKMKGNVFGGWVSADVSLLNPVLYLDVSEVYRTREWAELFTHINGQQAYYDLEQRETVYVAAVTV